MKKLLTMLGAVSLLTSSPMIIVSSTQNTIAEKINLTNIHLQEFNIDTNGMPNDGFTIFVTMLEYISQNFADQGLADFANDVIVHASSDDGWYAFNDDYEKWTIPEPGDIINHKSFMIIANSQNESYNFQEGGNKDYLGIIYCTHYGYIQNETNGMAYIDTKYNAASQKPRSCWC
jgi:hypothetical protein